jgi:hypothetical protein
MAIYGTSKIRGLVMAPAVFVLIAGISPMAEAQDEKSGLSAPMEGAQLADTQRGLASPIEGSWVFTIDVIGQGTFNSLISFAAGGVVVTTASVPPASPFYGSWKQKESNRFNAAFYAFISDSAGRGVALSKISLRLHLTSRNELAGTAMGYTCDLQAENCINPVDLLQFTGKRLAPE